MDQKKSQPMVYTRQFQTIFLLLGGLALDASLNTLTIFYQSVQAQKNHRWKRQVLWNNSPEKMLDPAAERARLVGGVKKAIINRYLWNNFFNFTKLNGLEQNETGSIAVKLSQNFSPFWCLTEGNGLKRIFLSRKNNRTV